MAVESSNSPPPPSFDATEPSPPLAKSRFQLFHASLSTNSLQSSSSTARRRRPPARQLSFHTDSDRKLTTARSANKRPKGAGRRQSSWDEDYKFGQRQDGTADRRQTNGSLCRHDSLMFKSAKSGKNKGLWDRKQSLPVGRSSPSPPERRKVTGPPLGDSALWANGGGRFFRSFRYNQSKQKRNRLMQQNGFCNVTLVNVPELSFKYFSRRVVWTGRDIFTTVVDVRWRYCLLAFVLSFFLSWTIFTLIYSGILWLHGDFKQPVEASNNGNSSFEPCVHNVKGFVGVFLFSLESQSTIGYGYRYPSEECVPLVVLVCLQSIVGVMIQALMAGIVFAKLARPKKRAATLLFSKNSVISMRDGRLCFLFRVGDMRKSQLAEAHVRLQMIKKHITDEGELLPFHQYDMDVGFDSGRDRVFVVWPITICHPIDEDSPLYDIKKEDLDNGSINFEIIAILEGVVESTGSTTAARTSYLPSEIRWGHRFDKLVTYQRANGEYSVDFGKFHDTHVTRTPVYSAKDMDDMRECGIDPEFDYRVERLNEVENAGETPCATVHAGPPSGRQRPTILSLLHRIEEAVSHSHTQHEDESSTLAVPMINEPENRCDDDNEQVRDGELALLPRKLSRDSRISVGDWIGDSDGRRLSNRLVHERRANANARKESRALLREHDIL